MLSSMELPVAKVVPVVVAPAVTINTSAKMSGLVLVLRLTVPSAVSITSPRSAVLMMPTVMLASAVRTPAVSGATVVSVMSLRSLAPNAFTEVAVSDAPLLVTTMAPSATCTSFRSNAPVLIRRTSPEPVTCSKLALVILVVSTMPLSAVALTPTAVMRPLTLPLTSTVWTIRPSVAFISTSPNTVPICASVIVIEPPKRPAFIRISESAGSALTPDTMMLVLSPTVMRPSLALDVPASIRMDLPASTLVRTSVMPSRSKSTWLPARMVTVSVTKVLTPPTVVLVAM